jgi:membrane dipeptidase
LKLFDGHCDTLLGLLGNPKTGPLPVGSLFENKLHVDLKRGLEMEAYAQTFALFGFQEMGFPDVFDALYARFCAEVDACWEHLRFCRSRSDALSASEEGKAAAFLSIEGAEVIGCSPAKLEEAAEKGVRAFGISWNRANEITGTNAQEPDRGLSEKGKELVKLALELGMAVDVSHLSDPGFWDVEKLAKGPFIATHSNARAIHSHPRNLTDDMFRAIRDHGGTVGINLYSLFLGEEHVTVETVLRHIDHFLDLGGEKTLAMGGDLDGCEQLPEGISGVQDVHLIRDALEQRGYEEALLDDIFYNNLLRVLPLQA